MPDSLPISGSSAPEPAASAALRDLAAVLVPGAVVSGRILEALDNQQYVVLLRGRTLVAQSASRLQQGEVVRVQVEGVGDQITARLLNADSGVTPTASRLQALGLPQGPAAMLVLSAFESLGAPLQPDRLMVAVAQVNKAFDVPVTRPSMTPTPTPGAERSLPPPERLADAFALLARAHLPVSAPFVALALRAAQGDLPDPARALLDLRRVAQAQGVVVPAVEELTKSLGNPGPAQTKEPVLPESSRARATFVAVKPEIPVILPSATGGNNSGPMRTAPLVPPAPMPTATGLPPGLPVLPLSGNISPAVALALSPSLLPIPPGTGVPPSAASPAALVNNSLPVNVAPISASVAGLNAPAMPSAAEPGLPRLTALVASASGQAVPPLVSSPSSAENLAWRALLADPLPDGSRDGVQGIKRALAMAGLQMKIDATDLRTDASMTAAAVIDSDERATRSVSPLIRHLAAILAAPEQAPPEKRSEGSPPPSPASPTMAEAVVRVAREQVVQTLFPPDRLMDYDRVLGLPLMADGRPSPARLAVAHRSAPGGATATYLRVDAELDALGPISVRLSGVEGGAMAITLVASALTAAALAAELPDLVTDLRHSGITAGLRVVSDDGVELAGAASHE